jgi:hypothetical protein
MSNCEHLKKDFVFPHNLYRACIDKAKVYVTSLYVLYKKNEFYEVNALRRDDFHPSARCTFETVERILCIKRYIESCKKDLFLGL